MLCCIHPFLWLTSSELSFLPLKCGLRGARRSDTPSNNKQNLKKRAALEPDPSSAHSIRDMHDAYCTCLPQATTHATLLLSMCIGALESTTNFLSSGFVGDGDGRHQFHFAILTYERMPIITQWFRALATDVVSAWPSRSPRRPRASERLLLSKHVSQRFSFAFQAQMRMVLLIVHVHAHHDGNYKRLLLCTVLWLYIGSILLPSFQR